MTLILGTEIIPAPMHKLKLNGYWYEPGSSPAAWKGRSAMPLANIHKERKKKNPVRNVERSSSTRL